MAALLALTPGVSSAQYLTRPQIPWRTITTAHFDIHFPAEMEEWTRGVAGRMEHVAQSVNAVVGNQPASRVTIIVEDPSNVANGFALPFMEGPVMFLWPTPPSPSPSFGSHRGWGEALAVHEYGHIAHLTFPSRNGRERFLWKLLPTQISPVARKSPAWVIEGYATLIEGQLTGSGRPYSAGRAAVVRQWALEGKFPTYGQINGTGAFLGGNMRYLVGSAFLEWLQERRGDSSLVHLWRRMGALQQRSFDEAFAGVFGASAPDLYGAFTVDVMERALLIRSRLQAAGLVEGELLQRLSGGTGEPALSPDGKKVAVVVRSLAGPSRLVVWDTKPQATDSALLRSRARMLERDSLDVVPFDSFPRPRRVLATLRPMHGRSHEAPRWMPDGVNMLVTRDEPAANGVTRPDLFAWDTRSGQVRRITRGASIRQADPSPDGREAAATRCHAGICSLVLVDVRTGAWHTLAAGTPELVWHRPRFSPDGSQVAASYQEAGRWGIALVDALTGAVRRLPDAEGASRYAPAFTASGQELVMVSERGGVANLQAVALDGSATRTLTRVTGAALGPDVSRADGSVWFLTMRSGGYDLRRLPGIEPSIAASTVAIQGPLSPAAPPTVEVPGLPVVDNSPVIVQSYGLGPRRWRVLPGGTFGAEGPTATIMVANIDPIARLSVVAQGGFGPHGTWRGGSVTGALRRTSVGLDAGVWHVEDEPSRLADPLAPSSADMRYSGVAAMARLGAEGSQFGYFLRAGASAGNVSNDAIDGTRVQALGEARARVTMSAGLLSASAAGGIAMATGSTAGESWQRTTGSATLVLGTPVGPIRGDWLRGSSSSANTNQPGHAFEQFVIGGTSSPYFDQLYVSQRIALPGVPPGFVHGRQFQLVRAALGGMAVEPYAVWVSGGESVHDVKRVVGAERVFSVSSLGFARLPAVRARGGIAYSVDNPFAKQLRAYASLLYSP